MAKEKKKVLFVATVDSHIELFHFLHQMEGMNA